MEEPKDRAPAGGSEFLRKLRIMGTIEGISTLVLFFVAMPLKYMADMPKAVSVAGSLHGALFVAFAFMLMMAVKRVPLSPRMVFIGFIAAVIPFGPFVYDRWLGRVANQS